MEAAFYWPAIIRRSFWSAAVRIMTGALGTLAITGTAGNVIARALPESVYGISTGSTWAWTWFGLFTGTVLYSARNRWHLEAGGDTSELLAELETVQLDLNGEAIDGKIIFGAYGGVFQEMTSLEDWIRALRISAAPVQKTFTGHTVASAEIHTDQQIDALASIIRVAVGHGALARDPRDEGQPILKSRHKLTDPKGLQAHRSAQQFAKRRRPDLQLVLSSHVRW